MLVKVQQFCLLSFAGILCLQQPVSGQVSKTEWPAVKKEYKPWTRWWWMGSAVDKRNLSSLLHTYSDAGIGGVEIVPIYGAKGYESQYLSYLSPEWMTMVDHAVKAAKDLQMGVDIAIGTGWPIGGPQVALSDAASKLFVQEYTVLGGQALTEKIVLKDPKQQKLAGLRPQAVIAYNNNTTLDLTGYTDATGQLNWIAPPGTWQVYAAFAGKTLQQVKRAAPGGQGYTLDHFSRTAMQNYLRKTDSAYGPGAHGIRSFYNDSYEVFGANWTPDFLSEFKIRRGYDLAPFIRNLVGKDSSAQTARIKCDYRETMADLMLEHFTHTFTNWAHHKGALTINQAHGSPGNLLDMYAGVDIAEAETFGSSYFRIPGLRRDSADVRNVDPDPIMLKFASSAAHVTGHPLASTETFTWLTEHFKTSFSQCKPEVEQVFLSGINHVFFHGTTYSPASAPWPGWLFYASVNFVPDNSLWPHLYGLTDYITRCQSILQSGHPDNEILIYWPVFDAWQHNKGLDMPFKVHDIDEWLHPTPFYHCITALQQKGYSLDFASDSMLRQASYRNHQLRVYEQGAAYRTILVPQAQYMPVTTFTHLLRLAAEGATVIFQGMPGNVPGNHEPDQQQNTLQQKIASLSFSTKENNIREAHIGAGRIIMSANTEAALTYAGIQRETLTDCDLKFIRRDYGSGKYYYIVNHSPATLDTSITLQASAQDALLMDPQTGVTGKAFVTNAGNTIRIRLQLQSGEAMIVKTSSEKLSTPSWPYINAKASPIVLTDSWQLQFKAGGPALPPTRALSQPVAWTSLNDTAANAFSGTATYSSIFTLPPGKRADDYLLEADKINESAKVWINGQYAGLLWSIPFQARVGKYLKTGANTITIEVANLMANRIRYMDRHNLPWRNYHEINFVNINYKDFNASDWKIQPSGLTGPVRLVPVKIEGR